MGDTRAKEVRLSAARAVHVGLRHRFPVSAHVRRRLGKTPSFTYIRGTAGVEQFREKTREARLVGGLGKHGGNMMDIVYRWE